MSEQNLIRSTESLKIRAMAWTIPKFIHRVVHEKCG